MTVELPQDVWNTIMGYFHSSYKKTTHYQAIIKCKHFARRRNINRAWQGSIFVEKCSVFESYYITIIADNWVYWSNPDLDIIIPQVNLNRRVANGDVLNDFNEIFLEYARKNYGTHILSRISYS